MDVHVESCPWSVIVLFVRSKLELNFEVVEHDCLFIISTSAPRSWVSRGKGVRTLVLQRRTIPDNLRLKLKSQLLHARAWAKFKKRETRRWGTEGRGGGTYIFSDRQCKPEALGWELDMERPV